MAGALLPVDQAAVHAGLKLRQRIELGAVAAVLHRFQAVHERAREEARGVALHGFEVGGDRDLVFKRFGALAPGEAQGSLPADVGALQPAFAAAHGIEAEAGDRLTVRDVAGVAGRFDGEELIGFERHFGGAGVCAREGEAQPCGQASGADAGHARHVRFDQKISVRAAQLRVGDDERQNGKRPRGTERPGGWGCGREHKRKRRAGGGENDRAGGGSDHLGASVWSMIVFRAASVVRPSISAAGERITRWRSAGSANAFTSSGMT